MWLTRLGFALLLWIPAELHAQSAEKSCNAPNLINGYVFPEQDSYPPETELTYACYTGYKPKARGWWATVKCQNGKWSQEPECIDKAACSPPTIPNGSYNKNPRGWFEDGQHIKIICNLGYMPNNQDDAVCENGIWLFVPVCEKNPLSCSEPPRIPNAVIINQKYQEVFAVRSELEYQCKDGYVTEEGATKSRITCSNGIWIPGSTCRPSDSSGSNGGNTKSATYIDRCGDPPEVLNSVSETDQRSVKYTCVNYYKLVGPQTVLCFSDGTWSKVPTCKEDFCLMTTGEHPEILDVGNKFIRNGETLELECTNVWTFTNYIVVQCINGKLHKSRCCTRAQINLRIC